MITWLAWIAGIAAVLVVASLVALWSYGRFARRVRGSQSFIIPPGEDAPLDRALAAPEAARPGQSGAALSIDGRDAFAQRMQSAALARRSVDAMYYIWRDDVTGRLLAHALLEAADRGVRVRLLLDDVNILGRDPTYLALNSHPRIEVRLFNPIRTREGSIRRGIELILNLVRYHRRMHCKAWIVDGRYALIGGRNIGDEYFGARHGRRRNVRDLDLALAGAILRDAEAVFDSYWNDGQALPIAALWKKRRSDLTGFRAWLAQHGRSARSREWRELARPGPCDALALDALHWGDTLRLIADPPEKALGTGRRGWLPAELQPMLRSARRSLQIVTPYFVPGSDGMRELVDGAGQGAQVTVVTNTLAVVDHAFVHGAYRRYRKPLLAAGVELYEVYARVPPRLMLHSKAAIVDGEKGFIGSFNFDMRSAFLNTEMGVLFDDPRLIEALQREIDWLRAPDQSFRLRLVGRFTSWQRDGAERHRMEPGTSTVRRTLSFIIGHLPIHRWL
jgi:cardiolipin synthase C